MPLVSRVRPPLSKGCRSEHSASATGMGGAVAGPPDQVHTVSWASGMSRSPGRGRGAGGGSGCYRRILQTAAECLFFLFFFLKNSSYSSLPLQTSAWPLTHPNSPIRPGTDWVRVCHCPTLPRCCPQSQWGNISPVCFPLRPYSPPCYFKHPGPSWCCSNLLVWQGREPLTWLSPKNPVAAPVPELVPGTLLS